MEHVNWLDVFVVAAPILSAVISALATWLKVKVQLPAVVKNLIKNNEVMKVVYAAVANAALQSGKTDEEKRAFARDWAKQELTQLFGDYEFKDVVVNYLIEHALATKKLGKK